MDEPMISVPLAVRFSFRERKRRSAKPASCPSDKIALTIYNRDLHSERDIFLRIVRRSRRGNNKGFNCIAIKKSSFYQVTYLENMIAFFERLEETFQKVIDNFLIDKPCPWWKLRR